MLNDIIKKCKKKDFPTCAVKTGDIVMEKIGAIVNEFNDFFVNVGPNLAKDICYCEDENRCLDFATDNSNSMFLGGVCESDVLEVVRKFKNKKIY